VRQVGDPLGAKVEVKNMNSFRAVERALQFERERQLAMLRSGERIEQETRGWVEDRGITVSQRTKEQAHDYRYFPEPDLPPLLIAEAMVDDVRSRLPELPAARRARLVHDLALSASDAAVITAEREIADVFEGVVGEGGPSRARRAASWIVNDLTGLQRVRGLRPEELPLSSSQLHELLDALASDKLTARAAKELLPQIEAGESPLAAATRLNLLALDEEDTVRQAAIETMAAFPAAVADYERGKTAAIGRLIGETIRRTGGRANPDQVRRLLEEELARR
jgi:aspartyl-tRNA(Asn)/glutamyl-tRNA(Gln) amidotransferase subunit B